MAGSVLFVIVVAALLVIFAGVTPFLLVPIVVIGFGLFTIPPLLAALRGTSVGEHDAGPSGVPTTREASHDPVHEP
jgi:hypothetical protein